ncbi:MAG: glycosyltransferase family 4 protein [Oscillospiraceae bacterium]|nr:glycosyltransferase family 4 protein [Oscillospiraceae bacterium]
MKKKTVLMCGSELGVRGGIVSVIKNYLACQDWGRYQIKFIPTHTEKSKPVEAAFFALGYARVLFTLLVRKPDLAHVHAAEGGSFYRKAILVRTFRKFGVKTVMHHHAAEFAAFYEGLSEKRRAFVNRTFELADVNLALGARRAEAIKALAPGARVEVLYNAVPTYEENPYNPQAKNILFLGRLGERKGTYDLLEALKRVDGQMNPEVQVYLCGDGEVEQVRQRVEQLGLGHRVAHIGWVDGAQKAEFLRQTAVNALPSYNEGLPMSILETMAHGIPCVSTAVASIPEVVRDGETGFLLQPGQTEELGERLLRLLGDDELRAQFSQRAWQLIREQFSLQSHMERLKELYDSLC